MFFALPILASAVNALGGRRAVVRGVVLSLAAVFVVVLVKKRGQFAVKRKPKV